MEEEELIEDLIAEWEWKVEEGAAMVEWSSAAAESAFRSFSSLYLNFFFLTRKGLIFVRHVYTIWMRLTGLQ